MHYTRCWRVGLIGRRLETSGMLMPGLCPSGGLRAALLLLLACFLYRLAGKYGVGEVLAAAFATRCGAELLSETPDEESVPMPPVSDPRLSIIIPTRDRPRLLPLAVKSALEQTRDDLEVVVVDDGSTEPVDLGEQPRLTVIRLSVSRGSSAARNVGARAAKGHWIAHLDDDDQLSPHFAEVSLNAFAHTTLPKPVAVLSGLEVVNEDGRVLQTHLPPTLPRGSHFGLEKIDPRLSFWSKNTLVVEREVLMAIGGFDESLTSLQYTDLLLRLNWECSILGVPDLTYRVFLHAGPQLSRDSGRRRANFDRLLKKHEAFLRAHPSMHATLVLRQAYAMYHLGQHREAFVGMCKGMRLHPRHGASKIAAFVWRKLLRGEGP